MTYGVRRKETPGIIKLPVLPKYGGKISKIFQRGQARGDKDQARFLQGQVCP